ncbi:ADP-ribosylation factor-like protein 3 [Ischnura elegans]|uniref:ADP-ribosylation factor-like protein 3 n=1 Tax=Ischnura elegans TaxID=197161 RepID=UPI001ED8B3EF|nr:ADP-ribosylation factor-like protein 3 [Ischnura elegans]
MDAARSGKVVKSLLALGSGVVVSLCAYSAFKYWKKRDAKSIDEGFEDVSRLEETPDKKIVVLGLEGAGKSTILSQIVVSRKSNEGVIPTEGFVNTRYQKGDVPLSIWEVGGRESSRRYWGKFLQDTDLLVFVVDASNRSNLPLASKEIKKLLGDDRLTQVPVLLIANKQDIPGAMTPKEVATALDIDSFPTLKSRLKVLGTQALPQEQDARHPSIVEVEKALLTMSQSC